MSKVRQLIRKMIMEEVRRLQESSTPDFESEFRSREKELRSIFKRLARLDALETPDEEEWAVKVLRRYFERALEEKPGADPAGVATKAGWFITLYDNFLNHVKKPKNLQKLKANRQSFYRFDPEAQKIKDFAAKTTHGQLP